MRHECWRSPGEKLIKTIPTMGPSCPHSPTTRRKGHIMPIEGISVLSVFTIIASLFLTGCSVGHGSSMYSQIVTKKLAEAKHLDRLAKMQTRFGDYESTLVRETTDRDSGREETLLFLKNINFRIFGNIGYRTERMVVSARPRNPSEPVIFDNPQSFDMTVLDGKVIVPSDSLTELLNQHVFNFKDSPIRNLAVETNPDELVMKGEMNRRGKWVDFTLRGTMTVVDANTLAYNPKSISLEGQSANFMLSAANIHLDEIMQLRAPGVNLVKSTLFLNPGLLFPPPKLNLTVKSVTVKAEGLEIEGTSETLPAPPELLVRSDSYIVMRGGDAKFLNVMPINIQMQIMSDSPDKPLDFSLYEYRRQLEAGYMKFQPNGGLLVYMKNYSELSMRDMKQ